MDGLNLDSLIKQMDFALLITASKQEEDCFNIIIDTAVSITDAEAGHLLLLDDDMEYLVLKAYKTINNEKVEDFKVHIGRGIAGNVFMSGQALNIADISENKDMYKSVSSALHDTENTIKIEIDDIAIVPIKIKDEVIGVLEVINKKDNSHFSQQDMNHLYSFAKIASIVIEDNYTDRNIREILASSLKDISKREKVIEKLDSYTKNPILKEALEISNLLNKIGNIDERELVFCKQFLNNYLVHLEKMLLRK
ncbi:GAF domain-containing protein [Brachyspira sp. G79]|uniref:GAF domain-containing protein n=1 Tax=Brachyspira sp. G79 TaxID=1358104 RepID=UPI000BBC34CE|nr:GAF domain-containing protein [Brachyspira sp. G79]PCG19606.1 hypothetical protein KQ44_05850 [Brachyspira sp. G79]